VDVRRGTGTCGDTAGDETRMGPWRAREAGRGSRRRQAWAGLGPMTNSGVYLMMDMALVLKVTDERKWSGNSVVVDSVFFQQRKSNVVML
jgi:hypothetical protein